MEPNSIEERRLDLDKRIEEEKIRLSWKELELKEKELKKKMIVTPLIATILAALVGFMANIISTYLTNSNKLEVEKHRLNSSLIVKAAETGDKESATQMLNLFVQVGYLEDPDGKIKTLVDSGNIPVKKAGPNIDLGKILFQGNCSACHGINTARVGPALAGALDRAPSKKWLYEYVRNSSAMKRSGDPYAQQLSASYNGAIMTAFPELTDTDIDKIFEYIEAN